MILLTAANGRTGRAVLSALTERGAGVRGFVRDPAQAATLLDLGAEDVAIGDLSSDSAVRAAAEGCEVIVHIGPPMHADEVAITDRMLEAAEAAGISRFVYYSVMHPLRRGVRHHALKLQASEHVIESSMRYTILEPCRYMQHLEPIWRTVVDDGVHAMPFSVDARFNVVDLADLAEATAMVATEPVHDYATYELAGPQSLSQTDMARILSAALDRDVEARAIPLAEMAAKAASRGLPADRIEQMTLMNAHYDEHGFLGNPNVLQWLLGRAAGTYASYVQRLIDRDSVGS